MVCIAFHTPSLKPDQISWCLEHNGRFSTKSLYHAIVATHGPEPLSQLWSVRLPLKIRIFLWQWIYGRVPSGVEVLKRNGPGDDLCPLCDTMEDSNHTFFSCVAAQFLWSCFREVMGGATPTFLTCSRNYKSSLWALVTLGGLGLESSRGRCGRFATNLGLNILPFDGLRMPSTNFVVFCSYGSRLVTAGASHHQLHDRWSFIHRAPPDAATATARARLVAPPLGLRLRHLFRFFCFGLVELCPQRNLCVLPCVLYVVWCLLCFMFVLDYVFGVCFIYKTGRKPFLV